MFEPSTQVDVLIVGAGSTGAVLASRLSENPSRQVLVLEAAPYTQPAYLRRALLNGRHPAVKPGLNWDIPIGIKAAGASGRFTYHAGKALGGSSAINATQALRARPSDFESWAGECGEAWSWNRVLPYFRLLENDPEGREEWHGRDGPLPIRREKPSELSPLQAGLYRACQDLGFKETADHNAPAAEGLGMIPKNVVNGRRISTAEAYLEPALDRANLTLLAHARVHRLLIDSTGRCEGVEAELEGRPVRFSAGKVILCAGAIQTPLLLQRSGIGPPPLLNRLGLRIHSALPGVGENLMDHPVVGLWGEPRPEACQPGEPLRQVLLNTRSNPRLAEPDLHLALMAGMTMADVSPGRTGATDRLAGLTVCLNQSFSRGHVRLAAAKALPDANLNCLGDSRDLTPLIEGVRLGWQLLQQPALKMGFRHILAWTAPLIESDAALAGAIRQFVRPAAHLGGSARMGRSPEQGAVVDPDGKVYGVDRLYIADASVLPRLPSAPPHLTLLMMAEKLAAESTLNQ